MVDILLLEADGEVIDAPDGPGALREAHDGLLCWLMNMLIVLPFPKQRKVFKAQVQRERMVRACCG